MDQVNNGLAKLLIGIFIIFLTGFQVAAQQKASIRIESAKTHQDSLFVEYRVTNKSDKPFTYYRPQIGDVELGLINMWIVGSSEKIISKFRSVSRGELDKLIVNKSHCIDILPGDTLYLKLTIDAKKFIGKARFRAIGSKFALSLYFNQSVIKCSDCNFSLLDEFLSAEKEIEQQ